MHELALRLPSPMEELTDDRLASHGVRVLLERDDLIHPELVVGPAQWSSWAISGSVGGLNPG